MNKYLILGFLFFVFYFSGCESQEAISRQQLNNCINHNLTQIRQTYSPDTSVYLSFENTVHTFEKFLLSENYLRDIDKESYFNLIQKIVKNPNEYSEIYSHLIDRDIYLDELVLLTPSLMLHQCVNIVLITEKNEVDSTLSLQNMSVELIVDSHFVNLKNIQSLFELTSDQDFSKLVYRIPFVYIITMNAQKNDNSR